MCLSRFAWISIAGVVALTLFLAAAAYAFRENLVLFSLNPRTPYQTYRLPPKPEYGEADAWAALPERQGPEEALPVGVQAVSMVPDADVFYIHPTTYYSSEQWNGPLTDAESLNRLERIALPVQASAFSAAGRIYAPRYRQATLFSLLTRNEDGRMARRTAYEDVAAAFGHYLREENAGRPFFIVGYGQGGLHATRLLREMVAGRNVEERLIAAYIVNYPVPADSFGAGVLAACDSPDAIRCVVSWNEVRYGGDPESAKERSLVWDDTGRLVALEDRQLVCVNPLTWQANDLPAPNPLNLGGVAVDMDGTLSAPVPEISGAECQDGALFVDEPWDGRFRRWDWPGNAHRVAPYNLFYMNIRENARRRAEAWIAEHRPAAGGITP